MQNYMQTIFSEYENNEEWKEYLVGADFCGAPWDGDIKEFATLFSECKSRGLRLTFHTAELALHAFETQDILNFQPDRLGHFIHSTEEQMKQVAAYGGLVEVCPTSNVWTGKMSCLHKDHPLENFVGAGLKFSICTDDLLIFDMTVSQEIHLMAKYHPEILTRSKVQQIQLDALNCSFLKDLNLKAKIEEKIASYKF